MSSAIPQFQFVPELPDPPEYVFTPSPAYPPAWIVDRIEAGLRTLWWLFRYNLVLFYWIFLYPQAFPVYVRRLRNGSPSFEDRTRLNRAVGWLAFHTFVTPFVLVVFLVHVQKLLLEWGREPMADALFTTSILAVVAIGAGGITAILAIWNRDLLPALGIAPALTIPLALAVFFLREDVLVADPRMECAPWYLKYALPTFIVGATVGSSLLVIDSISIIFFRQPFRVYWRMLLISTFGITLLVAAAIFVQASIEDGGIQRGLLEAKRFLAFIAGLFVGGILTGTAPIEWVLGTILVGIGGFPRPDRFGPFHRTFLPIVPLRIRMQSQLRINFDIGLQNIENVLVTTSQFKVVVESLRYALSRMDGNESVARLFAIGYWQNVGEYLWQFFCYALAISPIGLRRRLWSADTLGSGSRNWEPAGSEPYRQIATAFWDMSNGNFAAITSSLTSTSTGEIVYAMAQALTYLEDVAETLDRETLHENYARLFQPPIAQYIGQTATEESMNYRNAWAAIARLRRAANDLWLAWNTPVSDLQRTVFIENVLDTVNPVVERARQSGYHRSVNSALNQLARRWLERARQLQQDASSGAPNG